MCTCSFTQQPFFAVQCDYIQSSGQASLLRCCRPSHHQQCCCLQQLRREDSSTGQHDNMHTYSTLCYMGTWKGVKGSHPFSPPTALIAAQGGGHTSTGQHAYTYSSTMSNLLCHELSMTMMISRCCLSPLSQVTAVSEGVARVRGKRGAAEYELYFNVSCKIRCVNQACYILALPTHTHTTHLPSPSPFSLSLPLFFRWVFLHWAIIHSLYVKPRSMHPVSSQRRRKWLVHMCKKMWSLLVMYVCTVTSIIEPSRS